MIALDSNVIFDLMRGHAEVRENHLAAVDSDTQLFLSCLVAEEVAFGVARAKDVARERRLLRLAAPKAEVVPFEASDAQVCGRLRAELEAAGRRAPYGDFLIGAHAFARGLTLVTSNTRHFENIPGLSLLDWRRPPIRTEAFHV